MKKKYSRRQMLGLTGKAVLTGALAPYVGLGKTKTASPAPGIVVGEISSTEVAAAILRQGGNAIDAVVAGAFAAFITAPGKCGPGGYGGAMMIAPAGGKPITCIDFNSVAPAAARPEMYIDAKGRIDGKVNFHGWLAAGVPGMMAGLQLALDRYGTKSIGELLQPAIKLAGQTKPGERTNYFQYAALAKLLSTLAARNSVESFYRGDIAQVIADSFRRHGGLVTAKDLAAYQAREVVPYQIEWNGSTVLTAPLGAGGLSVLEGLAILKALKWDTLPASPAATHARVEALRLVWKDRLELLGDPDFIKVPVQRLLSKDYARELAEKVEGAVKAQKPLSLDTNGLKQNETMSLSGVDRHGNLVALTMTHGNSYGAQVVIGELGLVLGHGMARFEPRPGHANSVAPGKRPLHNMCPSILVQNGRPVLAVGGAGGTKIPNAMFDFFAHYIGRGHTMEEALGAPRLNSTGTLTVELEKGWPKEDASYLKNVGYKIGQQVGAMMSVTTFDSATGLFKGKFRSGNPFNSK
jgi:gamma-glutamyltranspeptidase/glutathione hydrolase